MLALLVNPYTDFRAGRENRGDEGRGEVDNPQNI